MELTVKGSPEVIAIFVQQAKKWEGTVDAVEIKGSPNEISAVLSAINRR